MEKKHRYSVRETVRVPYFFRTSSTAQGHRPANLERLWVRSILADRVQSAGLEEAHTNDRHTKHQRRPQSWGRDTWQADGNRGAISTESPDKMQPAEESI